MHQNHIYKLLLPLFLATSVNANAQTVYFQRGITNPSTNGYITSIPVVGPASALTNIVSGIVSPNTAGVAIKEQTFFYSDLNTEKIFLTDKAGNITEVVGVNAGLINPTVLSYDSTKYLYIYDSGSDRIVRVDTTLPFPLSAVEVIAQSPSVSVESVSDIKYNSTDGKIYWVNSGTIYRAALNSALPVTSADTLIQTNTGSVVGIDFDSATPQKIFILDNSPSFKGIYRSVVPILNNNLAEEQLIDTSSNFLLSYSAIALDKSATGTIMCISVNESAQKSLACGDRSNPSAFTTILNDPADGTVFDQAPAALIIESVIVPTPTPTASPTVTATITSTPITIVRPDTQPLPPTIVVNATSNKISAVITLQLFLGADPKKLSSTTILARLLGISEQEAKKKAKIGFQYSVEIKRLTDTQGNPYKKKDQDLRKLTTKRNELTVKNLKANSNYDVRYKVEITSKQPGEDLKVIKKTPFSPTSSFTVN